MKVSTKGKLFSFCLIMGAMLFLDAPKAQAQYFAFGKNRMQYRTFEWRFIQSKHFDIYYYETKNYDLAVFAALSLETSLKQYSQDYNHLIADRVEVIVYDSHNDFAQTNVVGLPINPEGIGGVTDLMKNRITIPFTGNLGQFRAVLQHELNHAVLNDMFYGGSIQNAIGRGAVRLPLWFNEGLGEYESKGWDTETDAFIRDAILSDNLPPVKQIRGYMSYRAGESIWNYIVEEYGRSKIAEILGAVQATHSVEAAFTRALGVDLEDFSDDWQQYYREMYFPSVAERTRIGDIGEKLSDREEINIGVYNTSPSLSPEGDRIAIISNGLRSFNVYILNTITGEIIQKLIDGSNNTNFAELNILTPNLSWNPGGSKIALSAKSEGHDRIAIADVNSGDIRFISFEKLDAIGSVAWSPDGEKLAFTASVGPFQDIYVYNLNTEKLQNITSDAVSDMLPHWGPDSQVIYFTSYRGDQLKLGTVRNATKLLAKDDLYSSDIYSVKVGEEYATRLTATPHWNEFQPEITTEGDLLFVSDENGIDNIYKMNMQTGEISALTNLLTGARQFSINSDGSIMAISTIDEGYTDIYTINSPLTLEVPDTLKNNHWAVRRMNEALFQRVPAIGYVQNMARNMQFIHFDHPLPPIATADTLSPFNPNYVGIADTLSIAQAGDTTGTNENVNQRDKDEVDFRNYVFAKEVTEDSVFVKQYMDKRVFDLENNITDDERYVPIDYRLRFSVDIVFGGGGFSTYYGTYGLAQIQFSDLLGNHRVAFGSSLNFDLVNSNYFLQYGNFKGQTDWLYSLSHTSFKISSATRYRILSGSVTARYALNTYERFDFKMAVLNIARDFGYPGVDENLSSSSSFLYPQIIYTNDRSIQGLITPISGYRYSVAIGGSPPITEETLQFASIIGDFRKYLHIGGRYSLGLRYSGGASFGGDSQTFFMGGMLGWLNGKANEFTTPSFDKLADAFITAPAIPLRGYERFAMSGDRFSLINLEFRFPLFAAILPGPIPILPLFNITGIAFIDAGMAWGEPVFYTVPGDPDFPGLTQPDGTPNEAFYYQNSGKLDFAVRKRGEYNGFPAPEGDVLIGAGFGLRAIVFGLPLRYDIGWPYYRDGFGGDPIHYITLGIDF